MSAALVIVTCMAVSAPISPGWPSASSANTTHATLSIFTYLMDATDGKQFQRRAASGLLPMVVGHQGLLKSTPGLTGRKKWHGLLQAASPYQRAFSLCCLSAIFIK